MKRKYIKYILRIILVLFFAGLSVIFFYSSPQAVVDYLGVQNAYWIIFILAFLGGVTTFSGVPYHWVLITLAIGGINPLLLGLSTATGVMLGDATSYVVGHQGAEIVPVFIQKFLKKISRFGFRYPRLLPLLFFLYGACSPFSNDFIVISMGMAKYPFFKVMVPLALGNLVFNITLAYFATQAFDIITTLFM